MQKQKTLLQWVSGLALIGLVISAYSFLHKQGFVSGTFCSFDETFNCDVVNQGPYSSIFGIPVALIGILGYGFMALAAWLKSKTPPDKGLTWFLLLVSIGALAFSFYLSGIEAFILHTWCLLCLSSQLVIIAISILVAVVFRSESNHPHP